MAVKTKKNAKETSLRIPKAKSKLGLSVPRIGMPHGEFVRGDSEKRADLDSVIGVSGQGGQTGLSAIPSLSSVSGESGEAELSSMTSVSAPTAQTTLSTTNTVGTGTDVLVTEDEPTRESAEAVVLPVFTEVVVESGDQTGAVEPPHMHTLTAQTTHASLSTITGQTSQTQMNAAESRPIPTVAAEIPVTIAPVFRGKSAQLFDVIYNLTLGAAIPQRTVRIRKGELMRRAGIGSRNTFTANLDFLISSGLVGQTVIAGESDGNEFEILQVPTMTGQTGQTTQTAHPAPRTVPLAYTQDDLNQQNTPVELFVQKIHEASYSLTGRPLAADESRALDDLANAIIRFAGNHTRTDASGISPVMLLVDRIKSGIDS